MSSAKPEVSVIIPAYNAVQTLSLQLEALGDQVAPPPFEVIVVDNGSTDGTGEMARAVMETAPYPLQVISATKHQGPGYARNAGVKEARANFLMFADADDVVSQGWVAAGRRAFESSRLWSGGARWMSGEDMDGSVDEIRSSAEDTLAWEPVQPGDLENAFPVVMGCDFGCTREVFYQIGGFDQSHGTAFEDNDFGLRAHLHGVRVDLAPGVRIAYKGISALSAEAARVRKQARGHVLDVVRYGLKDQSPMPNPAREVVRASGAALLMAAGIRVRNWPGVFLRFKLAQGLIEGRILYATRFALPAPQIGVGLYDDPHARREDFQVGEPMRVNKKGSANED